MSARPLPDSLQRLRAVSLDAAAELLGVSKRTLQRLIAAGEFPKPIKVGAASRLLLDDVRQYIDAQRGRGGR